MEQELDQDAMTKFIKERSLHPREEDFREYIRSLLSTFMTEKYLKIYMSDEILPMKAVPANIDLPKKPSFEYGPFSIIRQAFTDELISTLNLTHLEFYGDGRLGTSVQIFIMTNFPNLRNAEVLNNMKRFYTNNDQLAKYADQLDMPRWLIRDKAAGVATKEKANIFESFIGALVLIGEFYIGFMVGETIARIFIEKFYSLVEWSTDPDDYVTPSTLFNDWETSLSSFNKPIFKKNHAELEDRTHVYTISVKGPLILEMTKGLTNKVTGKGSAVGDKAAAKEEASTQVMNQLGLTRDVLESIRSSKRFTPEWKREEVRLQDNFPKKKFRVPSGKRRGGASGKYFIFITEQKNPAIGTAQLSFYEAVARGIGDTELEAFKNAIDNLIHGETFVPVQGTDLFLTNPDITPAFVVKKFTPTKTTPTVSRGPKPTKFGAPPPRRTQSTKNPSQSKQKSKPIKPIKGVIKGTGKTTPSEFF